MTMEYFLGSVGLHPRRARAERRRVGPLAVAAVAVLAGLLPSQTAVGLQIERISVDSAGREGNGFSHSPALSTFGRIVAFVSAASNLTEQNNNGVNQIFVHDRETGATELVSVNGAGIPGDGDSAAPALSVNARYVAFESLAANLVPGDTNGLSDIFVRDRATGVTELVSVDSAGKQGNGASFSPAISYFLADGRYVAFESRAANLVSGDTNGRPDIFVRDRTTGRTERVSIDNAAREGNGDSLHASISADGRYVAFTSDATNLVPGDTNLALDVFVRDRLASATERASIDSGGLQANAASFFGVVSADGLFVAFLSRATNLVPGTTPGVARVFVRDRLQGTAELVSQDTAGNAAMNGSFSVAIDAHGGSVAFDSIASNLVPGDNNQTDDVFVHVRATAATDRFSINAVGDEGNDDSDSPSLSADGQAVAFASTASNLVVDDTNGTGDVFVATDCSRAVCGDGTFLFGCEQCDDGNTVDGDGCSHNCQAELVRGGGAKLSDCVQEWLTSPPAQLNRFGTPSGAVKCTDDDPTCDFGVATNDAACTFHVALCFNVTESRFGCTPSDVAQVELKKPAQEHPKDALDTANRDALEAALKNVGGLVRGRCSAGRLGNLCAAANECDSAPGRGDGFCRGRFVAMNPPLATRNRCTPFAPVKVLRGQKVRLRLAAAPSSAPSDRDSLTLKCAPPQPASRTSKRDSLLNAVR